MYLIHSTILMILTSCNLTMTMVHSVGADSGDVAGTQDASPDVSAEATIPASLVGK